MNRWLWGFTWLLLLGGMAAAQEVLNTDWGFFHSLELERPGLEKVGEAVARDAWPAARKAFADYLRGRETPLWFIDPRRKPAHPAPSETPSTDRRIADDALAHRFTACGVPYQFNEKSITWNFNPTQVSSLGMDFNPEWTWQFNRHPFWHSLGCAYWETGDERYIQEFAAEMVDWVFRNPVPQYRADQSRGSRWRTIEAGIRMLSSWPDAFFLSLPSPSFTDDAITTMVSSMCGHARYLMAHPTRRNWLTMEMNGLYTVGALFPEFREAGTWRSFAAKRLRDELDIQVYPDGAQNELAPGYHCDAVRNISGIAVLARLNHLPLPENYEASLERMYDAVMWLATPHMGLPPFNDSSPEDCDVVSVMQTGYTLFPQRTDFAWLASGRREGAPPSHTSHAFPYAGYAVQRNGWDTDACYLAFDGGPYGMGHQHEDKLSFVLTAYGRSMVVEGGIYMYDASKWRRYVCGPYAHNIVFIDGAGQHRHDVMATYDTKQPLPMIWHSDAHCDYVRASYGEPPEVFGDQPARPAIHTRRILFVKRPPEDAGEPGDFWVIADRLSPTDGEPHRYESVFHIDAPDVDVDTATHAVHTKYEQGPQLAIYPLSVPGLNVEVVRGQEEPVLQGWLPLDNASRTGVRPIPTPVFRITDSGVQRLLYVFLPVKNGPIPTVTVQPWGGAPAESTAAEIVFENGPRFHVAFPDNPPDEHAEYTFEQEGRP